MKFLDEAKIPTYPYPELRDVLEIFGDAIAGELRDNLAGIYLVGSIALGDFDLDSDVDFLVVTKTELTELDMKPLQDIQMNIHDRDCYPAKHLEGSYISIRDLNDWSTVGEKDLFYFDNGSTTYERSTHDNQWHVRWILREHGVTLVGQKPYMILPEIPTHEMAREIKKSMHQNLEIFQNEIDQPLSFCNSRFGQSLIVLTSCRMLHTLHTGTVQSKKAGVIWAKQFIDPEWIDFIDQSWIERDGVRFGEKISQRAKPALLYQTLDFIQYALSLIDNTEFQAG